MRVWCLHSASRFLAIKLTCFNLPTVKYNPFVIRFSAEKNIFRQLFTTEPPQRPGLPIKDEQYSKTWVGSLSKMDNIAKIWMGGTSPACSPYIKPLRLFFVQNGVEKFWDILKIHESVSTIIYNKTRNSLVFVKQFRPAVYHGIITEAGLELGDVDLEKFPPKLGITLELCAGIVDKDKRLVDIAREEILEECGYDVPRKRMEKVITFRVGVGASGAQQKMYYCEVTDTDRVSNGGGVDDELIDVVEYSLESSRELIAQGSSVNSPPSLLFGVLWFLTNKAPKKVA